MEGGWGLHSVLQARTPTLDGIVNGIDLDEWNPASDRHTPAKYSANSLSGDHLHVPSSHISQISEREAELHDVLAARALQSWSANTASAGPAASRMTAWSAASRTRCVRAVAK